MTKRGEKRTTMNIAVPEGSVDKLRDFCDQKMVKQRLVLSRLMTWFLDQEPYVQSVVTGTVDRGMEHAYAEALRQLANRIERNASGGRPLIVADESTDEIKHAKVK